MGQALDSIQNQSRMLVFVRKAPLVSKIFVGPDDFNMSRTTYGTLGRETQHDHNIPMYVDLYLAGKLRLDALITHQYSLEEINQALDDLEQGNVVGRALIDMTEN